MKRNSNPKRSRKISARPSQPNTNTRTNKVSKRKSSSRKKRKSSHKISQYPSNKNVPKHGRMLPQKIHPQPRHSRTERVSRRSSRRKLSQNVPLSKQQRRSISKVKVWMGDPKNAASLKKHRKSWQAQAPPDENNNNNKRHSEAKTRKNSRKSRNSKTERRASGKKSSGNKEGVLEKMAASKESEEEEEEEDEEEEDTDTSEDILHLPKNPEIYMMDNVTEEPLKKKFRLCCTCDESDRLLCWCKLMATVEIVFGTILTTLKSVIMVKPPQRELVSEAKTTVNSIDLTVCVLITVSGIMLLFGAGFREKFLCLIHSVLVLVDLLLLIATVVLYIIHQNDDFTNWEDLEGVWWVGISTRLSWIILLAWSALTSFLLFFRIRVEDQMNTVPPVVPVKSPQSYMTKVELFLEV